MEALPTNVEQGLKFVAQTVATTLQPGAEEDAKLVQKGMLLYRQGLVYQLKFESDQVFATVQDVTPVKVRLDLSFFDMSDCACPNFGLCRHKLAVFFAAYAKIRSVSEWVDEWREPLMKKNAAAKWGLQRAKDLFKASGTLKPNYDRWIEAFDESFQAILTPKKIPNPYVLKELFQVYQRRIRASAPIEAEWKLLYELIATIFSFQKLVQLAEDLDQFEKYFSPILDELIEDAEEFVHKLGIQTMPFAFDEFLTSLRADSSHILEGAATYPIERLILYRVLWTNLFKRKEWREEELGKLAGSQLFVYQLAEIHQLYLLNRDAEALEKIQTVGPSAVTFLFYWIDLLTAKKDWSRLKPYIELFVEFSKTYMNVERDDQQCRHFTRAVIQTILPYCSETKNNDLYEQALKVLLPYSYVSYDTFLFEGGDYERWCELQAYIGVDLEWVGKDRVNVLAVQNPEILVILYHQSIQAQIDLKNRQGYRQAVRQLKKLRTVYKKLKRTPEWDEFFEQLIEKTKRLRAFHEECQRGKLIHA
ncbi:SWIM zinc finger family protein [Bacillus sp. CGMCC 1.16607]|uniref:SWIM zinc finger family protein n=1 Tax=Bacillus sp. CGMCC 1.16607 TaxID=3351842 RepID=UPI0036296C8C